MVPVHAGPGSWLRPASYPWDPIGPSEYRPLGLLRIRGPFDSAVSAGWHAHLLLQRTCCQGGEATDPKEKFAICGKYLQPGGYLNDSDDLQPDAPKPTMNGGMDPREMAARSAAARRAKRDRERAATVTVNETGSVGADDKEEARRALMRILRGKGNDAAVVSAAKAVLDSSAPPPVDVESGLEQLDDEQLAARIAALREELATA